MKIIDQTRNGYILRVTDAEMAAILGEDPTDPAYIPPSVDQTFQPSAVAAQYQAIQTRVTQIRAAIINLHNQLQNLP